MKVISRDEALSHPFANGKYDRKHANKDFILGFESYKEWLDSLSYKEIPETDNSNVEKKAEITPGLIAHLLEKCIENGKVSFSLCVDTDGCRINVYPLEES